MKSYLELLPKSQEQSNIVFWDQATLNEIESDHLKHQYTNTHAFYRSLY